jgi:hypothetical protein
MHPIERLRYIARADDEPASSLATEAAYTLGDLSHYEPNAVLTACRRLLDRHPECGPLWWVGAQLVGAGDPFEAARRAGAELCSDATPDRLAEAMRASFTAGDTFVFGLPCDTAVQALNRSRAVSLRIVGSSWALRRAMRSVYSAGVEGVVGYEVGEEEDAVQGASLVVVEALAAGSGRCLLSPGSVRLVESVLDSGLAVSLWLVAGVGRCLPEPLYRAVAERTTSDVFDGRAEEVDLTNFALAVGPEGSCEPARLASHVEPLQGMELLRRPV